MKYSFPQKKKTSKKATVLAIHLSHLMGDEEPWYQMSAETKERYISIAEDTLRIISETSEDK